MRKNTSIRRLAADRQDRHAELRARKLGEKLTPSIPVSDIGLMVAYAYAAQFPTEVEKLVNGCFSARCRGWEAIYNDPGIWHFRFNGPTPEATCKDC
jgi:hypothetical protein